MKKNEEETALAFGDLPPPTSRTKKYAAIYAALQENAGKWAPVSAKARQAFAGQGGKHYPGVKTSVRGPQSFACFAKPAKRARKAPRKVSARRRGKK